MKIGRTRRYNHKKRGSHAVQVWMTDWECSITIGAIKYYMKHKKLPKGVQVFVEKYLRTGFGEALGAVLKAEFNDLKLAGHPHFNRNNRQFRDIGNNGNGILIKPKRIS